MLIGAVFVGCAFSPGIIHYGRVVSVSKTDREAAQTWWSALSPRVPSEAVGLWFGLAEFVSGDGIATTLYVAGTSEYDPRDGTGDWASSIIWWPEERHLRLPGLAAIPGLDWQVALEYATELVTLVVDRGSVPPTVKGIGVGWDGGDVTIVWTR